MKIRSSAIMVVVLLAAMVVVDLVRGESLPGYSAVFGLVACALLIVVPKWLGTRWLWRTAPDAPDDVTRPEGR